ncbi:hypothetical protein ACJW31_12G162900 [Castanea mollissima]
MSMDESPKDYGRVTSASISETTTSVHVTALDGLVNVNSLFTIAVFVGLSLTTPNQRSLEPNTACDADIDVARKLLVFEGPHKFEGFEVWNDGVGYWVGDGVLVFDAVNGECDSDQNTGNVVAMA